MKSVGIALLACAALVASSATAAAQPEPLEYRVTVKGEPVKGSPGDHFLTFNAPVSIPGVTLPAGTYVFSEFGPSLVQVRSADRTQVYALFFTAPLATAEPADDHNLTLARVRDTAPLRITRWFLPNRVMGHEFLYAETGALAADR